MTAEKILKVLNTERECIARQSRPLGEKPQCQKDGNGVKLCEYCDLCLSDDEILEVYDFLINGYELLQKQGAEEYCIRLDTKKISQEELDRLIRSINQEPFLFRKAETTEIEVRPLPPDCITKILGGTD